MPHITYPNTVSTLAKPTEEITNFPISVQQPLTILSVWLLIITSDAWVHRINAKRNAVVAHSLSLSLSFFRCGMDTSARHTEIRSIYRNIFHRKGTYRLYNTIIWSVARSSSIIKIFFFSFLFSYLSRHIIYNTYVALAINFSGWVWCSVFLAISHRSFLFIPLPDTLASYSPSASATSLMRPISSRMA